MSNVTTLEVDICQEHSTFLEAFCARVNFVQRGFCLYTSLHICHGTYIQGMCCQLKNKWKSIPSYGTRKVVSFGSHVDLSLTFYKMEATMAANRNLWQLCLSNCTRRIQMNKRWIVALGKWNKKLWCVKLHTYICISIA